MTVKVSQNNSGVSNPGAIVSSQLIENLRTRLLIAERASRRYARTRT
jgi:hypothetical protein